MGRRSRRKVVPPTIQLPRRWRRAGFGTLLLAFLALLAIWDRATYRPAGGDDHSCYDGQSFRVVHVVDGDTFDIDAPDGDHDRTRIRLWGVDTPEVAHGGRPAMFHGDEASRFAKESLGGRNVVVALAPNRTRDRYGRLLAFVYLEPGGTMFNELLIEEGHAYADLRFRHPYDDRFEVLEKRARAAKRGLWAEVTPGQMPPWRQQMDGRRSGR
ncbi:MAG: thermonuclease family protein [Phycisphaerae bacterium]|nr:thermonuclease family protein [Phycisphaerae bacterium]